MNFGNIFNQIVILFLILLTGLVARKLKVYDGKITKGLSSIVLKITLPALIINSLYTNLTRELLGESGQILLISFCVYAVSFVVAWVIPRLLPIPDSELGVIRFVTVFSNVGFMGYPVIQAIYGSKAMVYTVVYNLPFNLLVYTVGVYILRFSAKGAKSEQKFNLKMLINPATTALLIGFTLFLFSIKLPDAVIGTIGQLGSLTTPLSMLLVGSLLAEAKISEIFGNWRAYFISTYRLLIFPVALWLVLRQVFSNMYLVGVPVVISAMPAAANTAILAEQYDANSHLASQVVFLSTLLSIASIPLIAMMLTH